MSSTTLDAVYLPEVLGMGMIGSFDQGWWHFHDGPGSSVEGRFDCRPVGGGCLLSLLNIKSSDLTLSMDYRGPEVISVGTMSASLIRFPDGTQRGSLCRDDEGFVMASVFERGPYVERFDDGRRYRSASMVFLPEFLMDMSAYLPFTYEQLAADLRAAGSADMPAELRADVERLALPCMRAHGSELFFQSLGLEMLSVLHEYVTAVRRADESAGLCTQSRLVRSAQSLIRTHLGDPLTIEGVAARLYVSRTALCAAFKRETGLSIGAWIARERIQRAKELLADGLPAQSVAARVGFAHPSGFAKAFKRHTGLTPLQWSGRRR
ncbi:helix-turn-helix transcriptional regulator [Berryella wangjianweii]|uniref:Helix-turn-helix transcriptional regulator n=1 Tax=Berryella wangjianweii TaxID=2734634 RepID=A0A6M8IY33_9ACTN|nr:AraC family transcriptional regulator [Berryella wangjianweii]QKF07775.1 helix-turn-helix transcriptional regulator [Berryella wangjianweii]